MPSRVHVGKRFGNGESRCEPAAVLGRKKDLLTVSIFSLLTRRVSRAWIQPIRNRIESRSKLNLKKEE